MPSPTVYGGQPTLGLSSAAVARALVEQSTARSRPRHTDDRPPRGWRASAAQPAQATQATHLTHKTQATLATQAARRRGRSAPAEERFGRGELEIDFAKVLDPASAGHPGRPGPARRARPMTAMDFTRWLAVALDWPPQRLWLDGGPAWNCRGPLVPRRTRTGLTLHDDHAEGDLSQV